MTMLAGRNKLPDEALEQLRAVLDNYDRLGANATSRSPGDDKAIVDLRSRLDQKPETLSWMDVSQAVLCVVDLLDEAQLRARLGGWRRRLREVAGETRYTQYLVTASDLTPGKTTVTDLRADLAECVRAVYYFYAAYGVAARSRSNVTGSLFRVALLLIGVEVVIALLFSLHNASGPIIFLNDIDVRAAIEYAIATSIFAVLGSLVSVQRRLQDPSVDVDPFYRYIQTTADKFSVAFVSPVFAAIFGVLTFGLLESKLLSTELIKFDTKGLPSSWSDVALLLIFGFLAGFAEQLVPDALTRIAARALAGVAGTSGGDAPSQPREQSQTQSLTTRSPIQTQTQTKTQDPEAPLGHTNEVRDLGQDPTIGLPSP